MPKRHLYPANWDEIAIRLKDATDWRCERCNVRHNPKWNRTLTVHHLDGKPQNCAPENLAVLCQACHLSVQARFRPEQMLLFNILEPWMSRRRLPPFLEVINETP